MSREDTEADFRSREASSAERGTLLATEAHTEGGVSGRAYVRASAHESLAPPAESRHPSQPLTTESGNSS